ncbi:MAG: dihydrolipoyl dehydrogenase [Abditibacteriales bacterium]|nr:dihydrolipoyl dehydrogenase [Abditibacteriales bacterium]MDW8365324.1 dihydrolipoyl dehydrogenase [Abditibacteriales bacterium]
MNAYDVVILGGGPGGYVAAIRAAQLGLRVALVEKDNLGGVCLNWGCIPTKALLRSAEVLSLLRRAKEFGIAVDNVQADVGAAVERSRKIVERLVKGVQFLMQKNKVEVITGEGYLMGTHRVGVRGGQSLEAKNIILATGGRPRALPGLEVDGETVLTSREAMMLKEKPQHLVIIGGGAIGCEFAYYFNAYGSKVTIVEMMPHLLPLEDEEISAELERNFLKQGVKFLTRRAFKRLEKVNGNLRVTLAPASGEPGEDVTLEADKLLVAVGVRGNIENIGLENAGVVTTEQGFIAVNAKMQTNVPHIYAIGDVTGKLPLAHCASAQGEIAAETIAGLETRPLVYEDIPRATYCQPQVASVGLTEAQARARGYAVKVGKFPFRALGKALAMGEHEGFVKVVVNAEFGDLLGAHLIGSEVTELLPEVTLARALEVTGGEIGRTVHAHPSLAEALMEAARAAEGAAIHL